MADKYNVVSREVSGELIAEISATIQQWKARLPQMVPLTKETRRGIVCPGANGLHASRSMAQAAQEHSALFPGADRRSGRAHP